MLKRKDTTTGYSSNSGILFGEEAMPLSPLAPTRSPRNLEPWYLPCIFLLLALSLQGCLGIGDPSNPFQSKDAGKSGQIGIAQQAKFKGRIYFTVNRNLYTLDGHINLKQLTSGIDARDPAISPDGKSIAFIRRSKNYSDLMLIPTNGGTPQLLVTGNGVYKPNPFSDAPKSTYTWYAQPAWSADGQTLLFLSDRAKLMGIGPCGVNDFLLDMQILSIPLNNPGAIPQIVAYSSYGDGGLRDPQYRPGHPDQIIYTDYNYGNDSNQMIQVAMEDPNAIVNHPYTGYQPGSTQCESDPSVAITRPDKTNLQPTFSPDGNTILYIRREDTSHMSLYLMPVPEGITGNPDNLQFNPLSAANQAKGLSMYDQSTKLLTTSYISGPVWSPDGTQIIYYGFSNNVFDIWMATLQKNAKTGVVSINANSSIQLTDTQGKLDADSRPCWTV